MNKNKVKPLFLVLLMTIVTGAVQGATESSFKAPISTDNKNSSVTAPITVYTAREIITMDPARPRAEAVTVSDGRIVGVGSLKDMLRLYGSDKTVVNTVFADKVIVPGLIEQHLHPALSALALTSEVISIEDWDLPSGLVMGVRTQAGYIERLRNAESSMPDPDSMLFSWGFHHYFHGRLTRSDLDAISDSRPIVVWHRSAHEFIVNSPALRFMGVTEVSISAQSESVQKQINLLEGHFWERGLFDFLLPRTMHLFASPERLQNGLEFTKRYLHASGVTTSAEPGVNASMYPILAATLAAPSTPFRFYFIPDGKTLAISNSADVLVKETEKLTEAPSAHANFLPKQVKLFSDGAIFSQLMKMKDGYTDNHHGEWMMEPELFASTFSIYWDAGYQIHIHQNGDEGLEMILNTLEQNMRRNPRIDHRTTIVHFGFATQKQVKRIASLGAIVSANPYYTVALADRYSEIGVGPKRAREMVRLGDVTKAGISFSFHSDMPMAPAQPLYLMWAAVNRITFSGQIAGSEQRISVEDAMKAVTIAAAYSLRLEKEIGSISPGKLADFTILESSPFEVEKESIKDIKIWGTVLKGRLQPIVKL